MISYIMYEKLAIRQDPITVRTVLKLSALILLMAAVVTAGSSDVLGIPDPEAQPLMRVADVERALPQFGRTAIYDAINRGDIPSLRVGRRLFVPTAELRRMLGLPARPAA
jgi:hypothetical protein